MMVLCCISATSALMMSHTEATNTNKPTTTDEFDRRMAEVREYEGSLR